MSETIRLVGVFALSGAALFAVSHMAILWGAGYDARHTYEEGKFHRTVLRAIVVGISVIAIAGLIFAFSTGREFPLAIHAALLGAQAGIFAAVRRKRGRGVTA